ncbi:T9SS type A sorting domain-containing protein [Lacinutrix sp. C3R15]|uniref:T9SS type A sorting domain-containing protein n=1 Tax=Flavobacteriaceae TaxID=49546 RepID=UPI001C08350E|nr:MULTISPECIES: T9SS type A sorting domain-containing protein [Flavobacteriaceae]MBU2938839.1 T9SS type A sorting domain-containing protein [Lacinutrix sp. C3R15]MDO6622152.1 T9SS type A sorting domain-containing protein [Oceanihabitans sp. 1_MG-2023]
MKLKLLFTLLFSINLSLAQIAAPPVPETWENDIWFTNQWLHFSTVDYTFNQDCLPVLAILQVLDFSTSTFVDSARLATSYNANNQILETINELWNSDTQIWENDRKSTQAYAGNNLIEIINYLWIDNTWQLDSRITNTYNTNNLIIESTIENRDVNTNTWINATKQEFTYNAVPLLINTLSSEWDLTNQVWTTISRATFVYAANNLLHTKTSEDWENNNWVNKNQETYTFDANDFLTQVLVSQWQEGTATYNAERRELYTNNSQGYYTELIRENYLLGSWTGASRDRRTYPECYTLHTKNNTSDAYSIYPIPAKSTLHITLNRIHSEAVILDLNGRIVYKQTLFNKHNTIDISQLNIGIYLLKITNQNQTITKKIIKQ